MDPEPQTIMEGWYQDSSGVWHEAEESDDEGKAPRASTGGWCAAALSRWHLPVISP